MGKDTITTSTAQILRARLVEKAREYSRTMGDEEALQRALAEVGSEADQHGPNRLLPEETLSLIRRAQENAGAPLGDLAADDFDSDDLKDALSYAAQCRSALLDAMAGSVRRSFAFRDTAKSCFGPGELTGELSDRGWLYELMQLPGEGASDSERQQARLRNEIVVLTAAMGEGLCTPEVFLERYRKHLSDEARWEDEREERPAGRDYEAAGYQLLARELAECATADEHEHLIRLMDMLGVKMRVNVGKEEPYLLFLRGELHGNTQLVGENLGSIIQRAALRRLGRCLEDMLAAAEESTLTAIQSSNEIAGSNLEGEKLTAAYADVVGRDGGLTLTMRYEECLQDLEAMGAAFPENHFTDAYVQHEGGRARVIQAEATAAQRANPYHALFQIDELEEANLSEFARDPHGTRELSYLDAYAKDRLRFKEGVQAEDTAKAVRRFLKDTDFAQALRDGVILALPCTEDEDLVLYRAPGNNKALLVRTETVPLPGGKTLTRFAEVCTDPGLFFNRGMTEGLADLLEQGNALPHDPLFDNVPIGASSLLAVVEELRGLKIGNPPVREDTQALAAGLVKLKTAAEKYYESHQRELDDKTLTAEAKERDKAWLDLAADAAFFADKKLFLLEGIREHLQALAELDLLGQQAEQQDEPEEEARYDGGRDDSFVSIHEGKAVEKMNRLLREDDGIENLPNTVALLTAGALEQQAKSNRALEENRPEDAVTYGTEALVQQTTAALLKATLGKAGGREELEKMVRSSPVFQAELGKVDLRQPGALNEAFEAKFGTRVADQVLLLVKGGKGIGAQGGNQPPELGGKQIPVPGGPANQMK